MSDEACNTSEPMDVDEVDAVLRKHALKSAKETKAKLGGPLTTDNLQKFLTDKRCLRYETTLCFDSEGLDPHQFAEPTFENVDSERHCVLHIRSKYENHPEKVLLIVAYMAAAINYSQAASAPLCELLGAALVDMKIDDFYEKVCAIADFPDDS